MNALELKSVTKIMQKHFWTRRFIAVDNLSFSVAKGSIVGFVGPNGAGKTTSIKMLLGLLTPTKGELFLNGVPCFLPQSRKGVAFMSEQPYLYHHLTVYESLKLASNLSGIYGTNTQKAIQETLERVDLASASQKRIGELSKGMQQRLNMASALIGNPDLYIFDEPMSGLDPLGRTLFRSLFKELKARGKTIFFSTHILDDIQQLCENIVVISQGKLMYTGSITPIIERGFLGTELILQNDSEILKNICTKEGYTLSRTVTGQTSLFINKGSDVGRAQKLLYDAGIFCLSIEPKMTSLEDLLYSSPQSLSVLMEKEGVPS